MHASFNPYLEVIKWVFTGQYIFIGVHLGIALAIDPLRAFFSQKKLWREALVTKVLLECIQKRIAWPPEHFPCPLCTIPLLISAIRKIDREVQDPHWDAMKQAIFEQTLLPQARQLTYAKKWAKRTEAIACFLYFPNPEIEPHVLHLLKDPTPFIQYASAYCAAKLGSSTCANALLDEMNRSDRFLRHPFREAFLKGDLRNFAHLETRLESDANPFTRVSCLEVLSQHMNAHIADLAKRDLHASHKNLRIAAIRALGHYSDPQSISSLLSLLEDPEWEVRAIAARSLGYLKAKEALPKLAELLKDRTWWVRMNTALALKRLGDAGRNILEQQDPKEDRYAYEIAQYVLNLGAFDE